MIETTQTNGVYWVLLKTPLFQPLSISILTFLDMEEVL